MPLPPPTDPADLGARVLRAEALAAAVPGDLATVETIEALDALARGIDHAVDELSAVLAALPPDADAIPPDAIRSAEARAALAATPERFSRAALTEAQERHKRRNYQVIRECGRRRAPDFHARNDAFAQAWLDALRSPPDPEVEARREAQREAEERRKEAILKDYQVQLRAVMRASAGVLARPGSLAARRDLLAAWASRTDVAKQILEGQLALDELRRAGNLGAPEAQDLIRSLNLTIRRDGHMAAGMLGPLVTKYVFHRGLVAEVELSGEQFVSKAARLFTLAPIQHLRLTAPLGPLDRLFAVPELARLVSLSLHAVPLGDEGAIALAASPHLRGLRWLALTECGIGQAGVEALAAALVTTDYVCLNGNPADPTPEATVYEGVAHTSRPALAKALEARFGRRPWLEEPTDPESWPPDKDLLAVTD